MAAANKKDEEKNAAGETKAEASQRIQEEAEARVRAEAKVKQEQVDRDTADANARAEIEEAARAEREKNMKSAAEVAPEARLVVPQGQLQKEWKVEGATGEMVDVNVPKAFNLTFQHGQTLAFHPGLQKVDAVVADHWYSKANGMSRLEKAKPAAKKDEK